MEATITCKDHWFNTERENKLNVLIHEAFERVFFSAKVVIPGLST